MTRNLILRGALVWHSKLENFQQRDIYIEMGRIVSDVPNHAEMIDLEGYSLHPGLINAHDHLELNHYPRTKYRQVYDNAHQWGEDVNTRLLNDEEPFRSLRAYPLWDRLFIGGLKNLLCGATTVVHHGPRYRPMYRRDFPVRVLREYGWAHSLHFDSDEAVQRSYRKTPQHWPWFIHLAEGTDDVAAKEYQHLKALGCVGPNTVLVHGVGMTHDNMLDAVQHIRALVICPTTNAYLLGQTANVHHWQLHGGCVQIGSDSRLTANSDLLREIADVPLRVPANDLLRHTRWGVRQPEQADLLICSGPLSQRNELASVLRAGIPRIGDPDIMARFPWVPTVAATLDGSEKRIEQSLAHQIHRCKLKETGLEVDDLPSRRFWLI